MEHQPAAAWSLFSSTFQLLLILFVPESLIQLTRHPSVRKKGGGESGQLTRSWGSSRPGASALPSFLVWTLCAQFSDWFSLSNGSLFLRCSQRAERVRCLISCEKTNQSFPSFPTLSRTGARGCLRPSGVPSIRQECGGDGDVDASFVPGSCSCLHAGGVSPHSQAAPGWFF